MAPGAMSDPRAWRPARAPRTRATRHPLTLSIEKSTNTPPAGFDLIWEMTAQPTDPIPTTIRVLLVDDQPDVRLAFRYMLEADAYQVIEASNGTEALAQLVRQSVDVILTDLYMPWMDGLSLVRAVRSNKEPKPRIIAMSGSPNLGKAASLEAARILGADAVLQKPVSRQELKATIDGLLGNATPRSVV